MRSTVQPDNWAAETACLMSADEATTSRRSYVQSMPNQIHQGASPAAGFRVAPCFWNSISFQPITFTKRSLLLTVIFPFSSKHLCVPSSLVVLLFGRTVLSLPPRLLLSLLTRRRLQNCTIDGSRSTTLLRTYTAQGRRANQLGL